MQRGKGEITQAQIDLILHIGKTDILPDDITIGDINEVLGNDLSKGVIDELSFPPLSSKDFAKEAPAKLSRADRRRKKNTNGVPFIGKIQPITSLRTK